LGEIFEIFIIFETYLTTCSDSPSAVEKKCRFKDNNKLSI
jgi:hypothetical protein